MKKRQPTHAFSQELLDLYDRYVHGFIDRRGFLDRAARFAAGSVTAAGLLEALSPNYGWAQQVEPEDPRLMTGTAEYASPEGHGTMRGYFVYPSDNKGPYPGVLVIHENRGLNPYIADVVRRVALEGYLAFGPDALTPLGGYPGNDDEGRAMQRELDRGKLEEDFIAAAKFLDGHELCNGRVGAVGFCYGGWICNMLAVRTPETVQAVVPFYGRQADAEDVPKIKASLMLHYGGLDTRVNAGWPAYKEALEEHGVDYQAFMYEGANHGFHNDTTPRYDEEAAKLAWSRTMDFFDKKLKG